MVPQLLPMEVNNGIVGRGILVGAQDSYTAIHKEPLSYVITSTNFSLDDCV